MNSNTQSILQICDIDLKRWLTRFRVYWSSTHTSVPTGFNTFMTASYFGLKVVVKQLFKDNCFDLNLRDNTYQRSALSWAAGNGSGAVIKLLVNGTRIDQKSFGLPYRKGAEIDSVNKYGRTPLSHAVWSRNTAVVKLLINAGARVDSKDIIGGTPLSYAPCSGRQEVLKLLLKKDTQVGSVGEITKELLFAATEKGDEVIDEPLLETGKANVNARDDIGRTPLSWAAMGGHVIVAELLL